MKYKVLKEAALQSLMEEDGQEEFDADRWLSAISVKGASDPEDYDEKYGRPYMTKLPMGKLTPGAVEYWVKKNKPFLTMQNMAIAPNLKLYWIFARILG